MNHDDTNSNLTPLNDPEIEARIVAWVAGEASPFEIAELTRLINEKPELAIFKRRIEAVHGLAGEAVRSDKTPLRLSEERRAKLLQTIGGAETKSVEAKATKPIVPDFNATKKANRKYRQWTAAIATLAACAALGFIALLSIPHFGKLRQREMDEKARTSSIKREEIQSREAAIRASMDSPTKRKKEVEEQERMNEARQVASADRAAKLASTLKTPSAARASAPGTFYFSNRQIKQPETDSFADGAYNYAVAKGGSPELDSAFQNARNDGRPYFERDEKSVGKPWGATSNRPAQAEAKKEANKRGGIDDEKLVLSPFIVAQSNNVDYYAKNTLAGKRLETDLKDIGSATTVVTQDSLSHLGATSTDRLLAYPSYTLTDGPDGNFSSAAVSSPTPSPATIYGAIRFDPKLMAAAPVSPTTDQSRETLSKTADSLAAHSPVGAVIEKSAAKKADNDLPLAPPPAKPTPIVAPVEVNASKEPVSTFSLHVSDVSFRLAQAALAANESIDPSRIRPEEFYNAFNYGDPTPAMADKVSCRIEQAAHPFLQQRNLVRIALKVAASGRDAAQPLHLTVLLDHSGSMEREDRMATVQRAMQSLASLLGPNDRITLIGFARQPSLLAESLTGDQSAQLLDIIAHTPAEGGTNIEEALKLGGELARRQFDSSAQNRIVLLTDGAANLGNADPAQLAKAIEALRQQGIAFDACGVGLEGLDDDMLENLTRKGDGRYYVLNSPEAADAGFAHQLAGAFRPAAENVKLQVRFNPTRVGNYRLIGFEQHRLREEDFRNDSVDAAELAAEEAAVAVYQIEPLPQGEGELGEVYVRFRDASSGSMVERSWTLPYEPQSPAFDRASPSMQLAGTATLLAEKLRGGQAGDNIRLGELAPVVNKLRSHYAHETRVQDLATMYEQARRRFGD